MIWKCLNLCIAITIQTYRPVLIIFFNLQITAPCATLRTANIAYHFLDQRGVNVQSNTVVQKYGTSFQCPFMNSQKLTLKNNAKTIYYRNIKFIVVPSFLFFDTFASFI